MNQKIGLNTLKRSMVESQVCKNFKKRVKREFVVERKEAPTQQLRHQLQPLKRRLMLRKHLLHLAHLFHKSEQLLSNRSHRRKPYNLFPDRKIDIFF